MRFQAWKALCKYAVMGLVASGAFAQTSPNQPVAPAAAGAAADRAMSPKHGTSLNLTLKLSLRRHFGSRAGLPRVSDDIENVGVGGYRSQEHRYL
jgi:hypothetical protein